MIVQPIESTRLGCLLVMVLGLWGANAAFGAGPAQANGGSNSISRTVSINEPMDEPIGDQAGTQRIGLSNGLEVVVVSTSAEAISPAGATQAWLIVRAGSMYEGDDQRGSPKVIERAIRMGTAHFTSDEISALLRHKDDGEEYSQGSFVSFDQMTFMGSFDDARGFERLLGFYRDVLDRQSRVLDDARIETSRRGLIEQINDEPSADQRAWQRWLPELLSGSLMGERLATPSVDELESLDAGSVRRFGDAFVEPSQATLVVVGGVDPDEITARVAKVLSSVPGAERRAVVDGRIKEDLSMRSVIGIDPGFERDQGAMIWFNDRKESSAGELSTLWSVRAGAYSRAQMRQTIIERVAGEVVRYRLGRLSPIELGAGVDLSVEQIDLWGQVDLMQIAIESAGKDEPGGVDGSIEGGIGGGAWADSIGFLVRQCDRLARDGASEVEIGRARRTLLSRWHRDADDWIGSENSERIGLVHWLVTTGRPMIDMVRWDRLAGELMSGISNAEINGVMRSMIDPRSAAYIALSAGGASGDAPVRAVVERALDSAMDPIALDWMDTLGGALMDAKPTGGKIGEISQHPGSGVWSATLSDGVRVSVRAMEPDPEADTGNAGRVSLSATLWGGVLDEAGVLDGETLDAALSAWAQPASESRTSKTVGAFIAAHGLRVRSRRGVGYVQLRVDAPAGSVGSAMELMYVLLDEPMIEQAVFDDWEKNRDDRGVDALDRGLDALYMNQNRARVHDGARGRLGDGAGVGIGEGGGAGVTLDDAQRLLTQIVRNSHIDIGIAGSIDSGVLLEDASALFGSLVDRATLDLTEGDLDPVAGFAQERSIRVVSSIDDERGVVVGYLAEPGIPLGELRSLILSSMVLDDLVDQRSEAAGFSGHIHASVGFADAVPHRAMVIVRAWCDQGAIGEAEELIDQAIVDLVGRGLDGDELDTKKTEITGSISRYFGSAGYWSQRLSTLGVHGRRVEDLWSIQEGYRSIDARFASDVLSRVISRSERFRVEIVGSERGQ